MYSMQENNGRIQIREHFSTNSNHADSYMAGGQQTENYTPSIPFEVKCESSILIYAN